MNYLIRSACLLFVGGALALPMASRAAEKEAEYKQADANYYWRGSVVKADPAAVILDANSYREKESSFFVRAHGHMPKEIYVTVMRDWLEPITPPSMPASLGIAPDVMQIREPQGDVEVALPDNPANFTPATEAMPIPNGSIVKTGKDGTAAVLFGGIDSARLTPNSEAMVQQTVMPDLRSTRIDLRSGAAFSKVGMRPGEKQDYQVHTGFGVAAARGTDFVCITTPERTDVWVAQGTVEFDQPDGQTVGTVKSSGKGALQIIRYPVIEDARAAMMATADTMTEAMNFIPTVNLKVKTLHDQMAQGVQLTPQEKKYLSLMKHVPCLLRLLLVEPPAPPPAPPAPAVVPEVMPAPVPPPTLKVKPKKVHVEKVKPVTLIAPETEAKPVTVIEPKSKAKPVAVHAKKAKPLVVEHVAPKAEPVYPKAKPVAVVAKPAVTEKPEASPLPEEKPAFTPIKDKPATSDESGMTAEPLNHMGRIMQQAPRDDVSPRAKPVKLPDGSNETQSISNTNGTNDAPIENGPHDTTP